MTAAAVLLPVAGAAAPIVPSGAHWRKRTSAGWDIWLTGFPDLAAQDDPLSQLLAAMTGDAAMIEAARAFHGHGAVLAHRGGVTLAMTDIVASTPLYVAGQGADAQVGADAAALAKAAGLRGCDMQAALQIGLAGYTIGRRTLIPGLVSLKPGEIVIIDGQGIRHVRYARYLGEPDESVDPADPQVIVHHNDVLLGAIEDLARTAQGRTIALPLSGGLDSRAIASGLKTVGYDRVLCFSYGLPNNHEALGAKRVAAQLGYPWRFVDYSPAALRAFFAGETARRFFAFADRPDAMPFMQDVPAVERLQRDHALPDDAIIVNGQSGDYTSGNHIPVALAGEQAPEQVSRQQLFNAVVAKHFDLWKILRRPAVMQRIEAAIFADLDECAREPMSKQMAAIGYELSEFENRQSKYVVAGQRCYEFFGYDWRLPLWEPALVEYWRRMPLTAKLRQRLYRTALEKANWGGVWGPDWHFKRTVVPQWARFLRAGVKTLLAPAGRDTWHRAEKHLFEWFSDPILNYTIAPYRRVLFDRRGFRNALAWHAEAYLARKGLSLDAVVAEAG